MSVKRFKITREQLGTDVPEWVEQLLLQINQFNQDSADSFDQLSASFKYKTVELQTGAVLADSFPLVFKHDLGRKPVSCTIEKITYTEGTPPLGSAAMNTWTAINTDTVSVGYINNLGLNCKIAITFKVS